jgi:hypothetical protein
MPCHAMHPIQDLFLEGFSYVLQIDMHFICTPMCTKFYSCEKWVLQRGGGVVAHLPMVKVAGGLHGVGGARVSGDGGCFCSMKKTGEAGFHRVCFPYGEMTSAAAPFCRGPVGPIGPGWASEEGKGRWVVRPDWAEMLKALANRFQIYLPTELDEFKRFRRILNPNQGLNFLTNKNLNFGSRIQIKQI